MGNKLIRLMKKNEKDKIVAVIGAGHSEGLLAYIKKNIHKVDVV